MGRTYFTRTTNMGMSYHVGSLVADRWAVSLQTDRIVRPPWGDPRTATSDQRSAVKDEHRAIRHPASPGAEVDAPRASGGELVDEPLRDVDGERDRPFVRLRVGRRIP